MPHILTISILAYVERGLYVTRDRLRTRYMQIIIITRCKRLTPSRHSADSKKANLITRAISIIMSNGCDGDAHPVTVLSRDEERTLTPRPSG